MGLVEGDLYKYTHNLRLYLFPTPIFKLMILAIKLLRSGVVLKPKFQDGKVFYKLRYKPGLFKKESVFITATPLKQTPTGHTALVGGHTTFFPDHALSRSSLESLEWSEHTLAVPANHRQFVKTYETELMSGFYKKHDVQFDTKSEQQAVKFMHANIRVMNRAGIDFWIEGGTLLGALRDQKLIPWDHDLDFGMKYESDAQMKQLIKKLRKHFHVSVRGFPNTSKIWSLGKYRVLKIFPRKFIIFKEALCLDLFVYYEGPLPGKSENVYKYVVWDRNAFHQKHFFDTIDSIEFYGEEVPVPAHAEQFIEVKYGKDWRTPVKEWNVALDDGSIYKGG